MITRLFGCLVACCILLSACNAVSSSIPSRSEIASSQTAAEPGQTRQLPANSLETPPTPSAVSGTPTSSNSTVLSPTTVPSVAGYETNLYLLPYPADWKVIKGEDRVQFRAPEGICQITQSEGILEQSIRSREFAYQFIEGAGLPATIVDESQLEPSEKGVDTFILTFEETFNGTPERIKLVVYTVPQSAGATQPADFKESTFYTWFMAEGTLDQGYEQASEALDRMLAGMKSR